ncbi:hypothetical protein K6119_13685 [Paracrocinitomix mangrovi]|uniref:hypothetical protein n=1 Tax=Paracrocinitomix mangrovi TaxID=2862509 RepID=UPI001C8E44D4|nr:hypothetical protein [Paracrocinitomix mangrovi]UKN00780.1 hypothetical protein K6119_13685 [Paracrocinitomix mangrovi]
MLLKKIILRNNDPFEQSIETWAKQNNVPVEVFDGKESLFELCQSLVIINADHNLSRESKELKHQMERNHKPTREIDINGTMNASISSLVFWLENNTPENVLMVGNDNLIEQPRFQDYLKALGTEIK